jgi:hypothetical protein
MHQPARVGVDCPTNLSRPARNHILPRLRALRHKHPHITHHARRGRQPCARNPALLTLRLRHTADPKTARSGETNSNTNYTPQYRFLIHSARGTSTAAARLRHARTSSQHIQRPINVDQSGPNPALVALCPSVPGPPPLAMWFSGDRAISVSVAAASVTLHSDSTQIGSTPPPDASSRPGRW